MAKWYQTTFRRNLVDMHISEQDEAFLSEFDVKKYVDNLVKSGTEVAYLYTSNCLGLCYWQTKVGHTHKNIGDRDLVGELVKECKERGITPILYTNFWSNYNYERHPDWRCVLPDGKTSFEFNNPKYRFGVCCFNSGHQRYMEDLISELVDKYRPEGLWIDMAGAFYMCVCDNCKERFFRETGNKIPEKIDWKNPVWNEFIKRRYKWSNESFERLKKAAKKGDPERTVIFNSARYVMNHTRCLDEEYYSHGEFVAGDYNSGRPYNSFFCKLYYELSENKPSEFLCPVMLTLNEHNVLNTVDELEVLVGSTYLNNGRFGFIDAIDPLGTFNDEVYERMAKVYGDMQTKT